MNKYAEDKAKQKYNELKALKENGFLNKEDYNKEKERLRGEYISISSVKDKEPIEIK